MAELTIAVLMISILSLTAFMQYLGQTDEARRVACQRDFRLLREALRLYNEDHFQSPYPVNDASALYGRYLSAVPKDPWAQEYVIDPFLGRLLSRGADGVLETEVKGLVRADGQPELPETSLVNDDLVETFDALGTIGCVVGAAARVFPMDEGGAPVDVRTGVDAFGLSPDREFAVAVVGGGLELLKNFFSKLETQSLGAAPATLADIAVSPDGTRYAAVTTDRKSIWIGALDADRTKVVPFNLFAGSEQLSAPSWSKDQQELAIGTDRGEIWRIVVGAGAQKTVLTSDATMDIVKNAPSWSSDGKRIAYASRTAGAIGIVSPTGQRPRDDKANIKDVDVSSFAPGSLGPVAWSPNGLKIAFVTGGSLWIVAPTRAKDWNLEVTKNSTSNLSGAHSLVWR
ncbi:MAG: PD40 domain-containing protein [Candidatus Wallbacteria bacterium]|nr:PD40 domain-containing protein [Candidatus Wallbacteria bacterium]